MLTSPQFLAANVAGIDNRISRAALAAGRTPAEVTLVAVSKTQPATAIAAVHAAGVANFGENYVREALDKQALLPGAGLIWHFIGQLQTNKTRVVAASFDWLHTLDRPRLAERLSAQRPAALPPLNVCLQVMLEPEPGKGGVARAELAALAGVVAGLPRLALRGLMCIPPPTTDLALARRRFRALAELKSELNSQGFALDCLSMGMSGDFEAAILEGATHVRVGTALFGARDPAAARPEHP